MKPTSFSASEIIDASEAVFEKTPEGKMTARVQILKAGRAKNPRNYRSSAVQKAAKEGIYNGMRMFVNHSDKPPVKRSLTEMVAAVESTDYDPKTDSVMGNIEFFDPKFFEFAQNAKKYMGVSANHRIEVQRVRENSGQVVEDVQGIIGAHSVDWVVYPSAGGEIVSFARESEGADQVEYGDLTVDLLEANAPELIKGLRTKFATEAEEEAEAKKKTDKKDVTESEEDDAPVTSKSVRELVKEALDARAEEATATASKMSETKKKVTGYIEKAGLPERVRNRLINTFSDALEYVETDVKEAVDDAKAELKELGVSPRITGEGPTQTRSGSTEKQTVTVREGVEASFGLGKNAKKKEDKATEKASGKES